MAPAGRRGIGAIYLGGDETPFTLKDSKNRVDGPMRSTGVYVRENGTVGTIQKADLSV